MGKRIDNYQINVKKGTVVNSPSLSINGRSLKITTSDPINPILAYSD